MAGGIDGFEPVSFISPERVDFSAAGCRDRGLIPEEERREGFFSLYLIRHGQTAGNLEKRYIGLTDEDLCAEGEAALRQTDWPCPDLVFSSPLKRCLQTGRILFPGKRLMPIEALRECDFGRFENKNWQELTADPDYQAWIDSGGTLPFPGGESRKDFRNRSLKGFSSVLDTCRRYMGKEGSGSAAVITHGGVIMNIMETLFPDRGSFYDWQTENGKGWIVKGKLVIT